MDENGLGEPLRLQRGDWLTVAFAVGLLLTVSYVTYVRRPGKLPESGAFHEILPVKEITVSIEGCVANPGSYTLDAKAKMKDLLALAQPGEHAILDGLKSRLVDGQQITIAEQKFIRVFVEGAVIHSRFYDVPEGTRLGQLLRQIELADDAVTYKLKKRDVLVDQQVVEIPHRVRKRLTE